MDGLVQKDVKGRWEEIRRKRVEGIRDAKVEKKNAVFPIHGDDNMCKSYASSAPKKMTIQHNSTLSETFTPFMFSIFSKDTSSSKQFTRVEIRRAYELVI